MDNLESHYSGHFSSHLCVIGFPSVVLSVISEGIVLRRKPVHTKTPMIVIFVEHLLNYLHILTPDGDPIGSALIGPSKENPRLV